MEESVDLANTSGGIRLSGLCMSAHPAILSEEQWAEIKRIKRRIPKAAKADEISLVGDASCGECGRTVPGDMQ